MAATIQWEDMRGVPSRGCLGSATHGLGGTMRNLRLNGAQGSPPALLIEELQQHKHFFLSEVTAAEPGYTEAPHKLPHMLTDPSCMRSVLTQKPGEPGLVVKGSSASSRESLGRQG